MEYSTVQPHHIICEIIRKAIRHERTYIGVIVLQTKTIEESSLLSVTSTRFITVFLGDLIILQSKTSLLADAVPYQVTDKRKQRGTE